MTTNHEKYLAGEPLTPELKALKEGRVQEAGPFWEQQAVAAERGAAAAGAHADLKRPLNRAEKTALREMRASPGWAVLQKLLERSTLLRTEAATKLSQEDPLARSDEIARAWAYVSMFNRAHREMDEMVFAELAETAESAGIAGLAE